MSAHRTSVTPWLVGAVLLAVLATLVWAPVARCPECTPYLEQLRRHPAGMPTGAIPATCPACSGRERISLAWKWRYGERQGWYPIYRVDSRTP